MAWITLEQAAAWCGGQIDPKYAKVAFLGANNDSRKIQKGELFIALQGARDGHDYVASALQNGAAAVLCNHCDGDYPAIVVDDTRIALGAIAREERKRIGMKVVGVTGSVGKSTTKEMIACVLEGTYRVAKTPANHNNDIGMPMAVLSIPEDTEVAVLEMGMNHFREIAYLTSIALPDVAVIINIGTMHIEHLGSQEGILKAKLEILEGMQPDGKVILNGDDRFLQSASGQIQQPITYFGAKNPDCGVQALDAKQLDGHLQFTAKWEDQTLPIELAMEGEHYIADALAAISVGLALGVSQESIRQQLASFRNLAGRQEILEQKGYTIIKDCYNAGPESMAAALKVLGNKAGRRVAVLGDMLELGACAPTEHHRIGLVAAKNADIVLAYGPNSGCVVTGAREGGMAEENALAFEDRDCLVAVLKRLAKQGEVMLFKGSHGMHMELALEKFLKDDT